MKTIYFFSGIIAGFLLIYFFTPPIQEENKTSLTLPDEPTSAINTGRSKHTGLIIDSNMRFEEAVGNTNIPENIKNQLALVNVKYFSFDGNIHQGQIIVNKSLSGEVALIFKKILERKIPIQKVLPVSYYNNSDEASMQSNNTSSFNFRRISGKKQLSKHAYGLAIDINPLFNPFIGRGVVMPRGSSYDPDSPHAITKNSEIYKIFKSHGWKWGGEWNSVKDYQHFEKVLQ